MLILGLTPDEASALPLAKFWYTVNIKKTTKRKSKKSTKAHRKKRQGLQLQRFMMPVATIFLAASFATYVHFQIAAAHNPAPKITPAVVQRSSSPTPAPSTTTKPKVVKSKPKQKPKVVATAVPRKTVTPKKKTVKKTLPAPSSKVKHLVPKPSPSPSPNPGSPSPPAVYASTNWSGYFATGKIFKSVSGSWVVPASTGDGVNDTADASWIGIGGVNTNDLIQTGTYNVVAADGTVSSQAFWETLPDAATDIPDITVSPGDSMSASVTEISAGIWTIDITDNTNNQTFSTTIAYASGHSSAEWIEEDPSYGSGGLVPFDNFGTVNFTGSTAKAGSTTYNLTTSHASEIILVDNSNQPLATPSAISSNTNFSVTKD